MTEEVRAYVQTKTDFFNQYFDVTGSAAYASFEQVVFALAEQCTTAQEFETAYANAGFYTRVSDLAQQLPQKTMSMKEIRQSQKEFFQTEEGKKAKEELMSATKKAVVHTAKEQAIQDAEMLTKDITRGATKQFMKDKGLVDDWTGRNKIDDALRYRRTKSGHLMETGLLRRGESVMDHVYRAEGSAVNRVGNFFRKKLGRGNDAQDVQDGQYGQEWQDGQDWED